MRGLKLFLYAKYVLECFAFYMKFSPVFIDKLQAKKFSWCHFICITAVLQRKKPKLVKLIGSSLSLDNLFRIFADC